MSTKATIARGKSFHFYEEVFDSNAVYLELEDVEFEAGLRRVMVPIPIDIWETIRHLTIAHFDLTDKQDDELQARVEKEVDERIRQYEQAAVEGKAKRLVRFVGSMVFGSADEPRDEQIKNGMEHYRRERERQQEILERTKQHQVSRHLSANDGLK